MHNDVNAVIRELLETLQAKYKDHENQARFHQVRADCFREAYLELLTTSELIQKLQVNKSP